MGYIVKKNTAVAVVEEGTEGTYAPPASAADFIQTLADGFELSKTKELLERNIFVSSIGKTSPRTGIFQAASTIPVEMRANSTEGGVPEFGKLLESALGTKHQITSNVTTKASGNTGSELQIEDIDITKFEEGDIVFIKEAGGFHVSPILTIDDTPSTSSITLLIPKPSGSFSNSVVISKSTTYKVADDGHLPLSVSKYLESAILEQATGCKVASMSIENFTTGQMPTMTFGLEGLNFDSSETAIPYTPAYSSALPPILLDGRVYQDATEIQVNEVTVSLENTLGFVTSIAAPNGRISSRVTERAISGTFNPYKQDDNIDNFDKFKDNTPFKLFAYGKVPTSTAGEFNQVVAIYMPNCIITELGEADQDGIIQEAISFSADRGVAGNTPEIYIAFM